MIDLTRDYRILLKVEMIVVLLGCQLLLLNDWLLMITIVISYSVDIIVHETFPLEEILPSLFLLYLLLALVEDQLLLLLLMILL